MTTTNTRDASVHTTETVVRAHLQAFIEQRGVDAIVADYDDAAVLFTQEALYRGRAEIHGFFTAFLAALPPGALDRFVLDAFRVEDQIAFIAWRVGDEIPLGTDTFVVQGHRIVAQTFAMCLAG